MSKIDKSLVITVVWSGRREENWKVGVWAVYVGDDASVPKNKIAWIQLAS